MKILVLNGPNLNMVGIREPGIYGTLNIEEINRRITEYCKTIDVEVRFVQSNHEGALIDAIQDARLWSVGIVINPGGYTHTSVAIRDAIAGIEIPVVEVHISNVYAREEIRQKSMISAVCRGIISGFGWKSYLLGLQGLVEMIKDDQDRA